ncbi:MAG: hypothetical protein AB7S38_15370 [Vulcanimicrobiota bacterium]
MLGLGIYGGWRWGFVPALACLLLAEFALCFSPRPAWRRLALSLLGLTLPLAGLEVVARVWHVPPDKGRIVHSVAYTEPHSLLGYAGRPSVAAEVARVLPDGREAFRVTYRLDGDGWRKSAKQTPRANQTVLCFGGSFMFGEGLEDSQTLPSRLEAESGGTWHTRNLAMPGYGGHQMLAILEAGLEKPGPDEPPVKRAYYIATLPPHAERAAGKAFWDLRGPRYRIRGQELVNTGPFHSARAARLLKFCETSQAYVRFLSPASRPCTRPQLETYLAIVKRSRTLLAERYGVELCVILWAWNDDLPFYTELFEGAHLNFVAINDIIPDYSQNLRHYHIPIDAHPNEVAYRELGHFLATKEAPEPGGKARP